MKDKIYPFYDKDKSSLHYLRHVRMSPTSLCPHLMIQSNLEQQGIVREVTDNTWSYKFDSELRNKVN